MATPETTVRDIAIEHPASIRVFEKYGIDYCCGGRRPLAQVCEERSLQIEEVLAAIENAAGQQQPTGPDWMSFQLGAICDHIVRTHHAYIRNELPRLQFLAKKVVARHGDDRLELPQIQQLVEAVGSDLISHLAKEEMMLFPYITNLERNLATCGPTSFGCSGSVRNPIRVMMAEHDIAGDIMARIRTLSSDYTPPEGACPTYRGFYLSLAEFEKDLHQHVHLENNILFPRAIELEESCG
ncbi:MAG: iron-sulfur cluster repair di-iron protein [Acidobacteria bacterium]|nr:iron-sulfur cluster repair di-iron protein [Acidobacteriota bacterium]